MRVRSRELVASGQNAAWAATALIIAASLTLLVAFAENYASAVANLIRRNNRRYGGYIRWSVGSGQAEFS